MTEKEEVFVYNGTEKPPKNTRRIRINGNVKAIPAEEFVEYDFAEVDFSQAHALESIGKRAFARCIFLKKVHLPPYLKRIESSAFMDCVNITEVTFGESLESLGKMAFYGCQCLKEVHLPSSLKSIDSGAFCACDGLTEVTFGESLVTIGKKAFARCRCLKAVHLPSNLSHIESGAFMECIKLTEVTLGLGLKSIGSVAFYGCESLKKVHIPPNLSRIESGTFCSCTRMVEVEFNSDLQFIGNAAFAKCASLKEIHIPPNLAHIDADAFNSCTSITSVIFAPTSSLKSIGKTAFANCECLKEVHFPPSLNRIEEEAFMGCTTMTEITFHESTLHFIGTQAFRRCGLTRVALPSSIKVIQKGAFSSCESLVVADFSKVKYLEKMGEHVLKGCSSIKETLIPSTASGRVAIHDFLNISDGQQAASYVISARASSAVDQTNNSAFQEFRSKFNYEDEPLFLGRYKVVSDSPVYKSTNSIVMKAWDTKMTKYYECEFDKYRNGENAQRLTRQQFENALQDLTMVPSNSPKLQEYVSRINGSISREEFGEFCVEIFGQLVALKFMRKRIQYERELTRRIERQLDKRFVVRIVANYDEKNTKGLATELGAVLRAHLSSSESVEDYIHVVVMPFADRTLERIFRKERPDIPAIRRLAREVGEAVAHLHSKGIVHGDLKLSNVVQINDRMSLINLESSAEIVLGYVGSNFSSGILPPEMIHQLVDREEIRKYLHYFKEESLEEREKRSPKYSTSPSIRGYVVRSFLEDEEYDHIKDSEEMIGKKRSKPRRDGLSMYKIVRAGRAFDVWSFGVLLYTLCSREPLFKVNNDDDIADGDSMRRLHDWGREALEETLARSIHDKAAKALLESILKRNPAERPTMEDILQDDFFNIVNESGQSRDMVEPVLENKQIMRNDFLRVRESLNRGLLYRKKAHDFLEGVIDGVKVPKFFVLLPLLNEEGANNGFSTFLAKLKGGEGLKSKAKLYFLCPISLRPAIKSNGEAKGYQILLSEGWLQRYGHAILIGLMIVRVALTLGRATGLPLSESEEGMLDLMNFFCEMQDFVVEGMGSDPEDKASAGILLEQFNDQWNMSTMVEGETKAAREHLKARLRAAYNGIASRVARKDGELKKCGLVKCCSPDGSEGFVHPELVPMFKRLGSKCFEMTWDQLELERALSAMRDEKQTASLAAPDDPGSERIAKPHVSFQ